ncbi:MAG: sulfotransferase domain-containing protein [Candidatus Hodarchaeota archaeon]
MFEKTILILSFRRSGTHLTIDSILNNFQQISKTYLTLEQLFPSHHEHLDVIKLKSKIHPKMHTIIKTHMNSAFLTQFGDYKDLSENKRGFFLDILDKSKKIYVYRDGRDVMVSLYYYWQSIKADYNLSFLNHLKLNLIDWKEHVKGWLSKPDVLPISFEEFPQNYDLAIKKIKNFLQIPLNKKIINCYGKIIPNASFYNFLAQKILQKLSIVPISTTIRPRKGIMGDWRNHFDDESKKYFNSIAGKLLTRLGYEKDFDW